MSKRLIKNIYRYMKSYVDKFELEPYIHFNRTVTSLRRYDLLLILDWIKLVINVINSE